MDISGKIIMDLGLQSGTSKAGNPWKKREMVLETFGPYPRKVKFHIFGDRVDSIILEAGKDYTLSIDIESREFNGRWYTDVSVFKAQPYLGQEVNPSSPFGNPAVAGAPYGGNNAGATQTMGEPYGNNDNFQPFGGDGLEGGADEDLPF